MRGVIYLITAIDTTDVSRKARWFRKDARGVEPSLRAPQGSQRKANSAEPHAKHARRLVMNLF